MPIKVVCTCGSQFAAPDQLAGKAVKCPKCGAGIRVPAPRAAAAVPAPVGGLGDLLDEEGIKAHAGIRCPACENPLPQGAALCTKCGYNLQTGQKVETTIKQVTKAHGHGEAAESIMERAALELQKAPPQQEVSAGGQVAGYFMALGLLITMAVVLVIAWFGFNKIESSGNSQYYAGIVMIAMGSFMAFAGQIALIVHNFKDGALHGVLSLVIPFYAPIYGALRNHGFWALLWFMGNAFVALGFGMTVWFRNASDNQNVLRGVPPKSELIASADPWILPTARFQASVGDRRVTG